MKTRDELEPRVADQRPAAELVSQWRRCEALWTALIIGGIVLCFAGIGVWALKGIKYQKGASAVQTKIRLSDIDFKDYFSGRRLAYAEWKDCIRKLEAANLTDEMKSGCVQFQEYKVVHRSPFDEEWRALPRLNESYNEYVERWNKPEGIHITPGRPRKDSESVFF